jgi:hypothetical protein
MTRPQELHDRATRGATLSPEEQAQLSAWYAEQDEIESQLLGSLVGVQTREMLQVHIQAALAQLALVTQRIQDLTVQNEELRREVASLKNQLAERPAAHAV